MLSETGTDFSLSLATINYQLSSQDVYQQYFNSNPHFSKTSTKTTLHVIQNKGHKEKENLPKWENFAIKGHNWD